MDPSHARQVGRLRDFPSLSSFHLFQELHSHSLQFFGIINLTFLPFIYAYYPETKGRSLEEIDVIFAKAYTTNEWYVKVSYEVCFYLYSSIPTRLTRFQMPQLSPDEIESEARRWGLAGDDEMRAHEKYVAPQKDKAS